MDLTLTLQIFRINGHLKTAISRTNTIFLAPSSQHSTRWFNKISNNLYKFIKLEIIFMKNILRIMISLQQIAHLTQHQVGGSMIALAWIWMVFIMVPVLKRINLMWKPESELTLHHWTAFFGIQIIKNGIHLGWQKCSLLLKKYKNIPVFTKRKIKFNIHWIETYLFIQI